jgi:hypothetical protein
MKRLSRKHRGAGYHIVCDWFVNIDEDSWIGSSVCTRKRDPGWASRTAPGNVDLITAHVELSAASGLCSMQSNCFSSYEICSWGDGCGNRETSVATVTIQRVLRCSVLFLVKSGRLRSADKIRTYCAPFFGSRIVSLFVNLKP